MYRTLISGVSAALTLTLAAGVTRAASISEIPAHDVTLNARPDVQDLNGGGDFRAIVGGTSTGNDYHVPIFRWSLSTVPLGEVATTNGTLTLNVVPNAGHVNAVGKTIDVFQIDASNAGWIEGNGDGSAPVAGAASWDAKAHPSTPWDGGEGLGAPGDGYGLTPLASFTYTGATPVVTSIPQSVLNDWIANPGNNAGIIMFMQGLDGTERFLRFYSNNGAAPATLAFETAIPEPGSMLLLAGAGALLAAGRRRRV